MKLEESLRPEVVGRVEVSRIACFRLRAELNPAGRPYRDGKISRLIVSGFLKFVLVVYLSEGGAQPGSLRPIRISPSRPIISFSEFWSATWRQLGVTVSLVLGGQTRSHIHAGGCVVPPMCQMSRVKSGEFVSENHFDSRPFLCG